MQLWLRADQGTNTIIDGNDVVAWADQSANGYSANADVNSTDDPTFTETAINFNPGIEFDGTYTDDYSDGLHLGDDYIYSSNAGMHFFTVLKPGSTNNTFKKVFDFGQAGNLGYGMEYSLGFYKLITPLSHGGASTGSTHPNGFTPSILEGAVIFGDRQDVFQNSNLLGSDPITTTQITGAEVAEANAYGSSSPGNTVGPVSIGRKSASLALSAVSGQIFHGDIAEVIIYNDTLSNIQRDKINSYLAIKYGLTCLLYTSPSPRDQRGSRMPSSA